MKKIVYHGSPNGDLKEISSYKSTHQKPCIYASYSKVVALLFMGKGNGDLDTRISTLDGKLELVERRRGILNSLYNHPGYLYELPGNTFHHYDYLWRQEVISFEKSVVPLNKIYYSNVLDAIYEEEKEGNITIYRYPNRPSDVPLDNSDLIDKYIEFERRGLQGSIDRLLRIYPEFEMDVRIQNEFINKNGRNV